jgi:hypothetical protein
MQARLWGVISEIPVDSGTTFGDAHNRAITSDGRKTKNGGYGSGAYRMAIRPQRTSGLTPARIEKRQRA